MWGIELQRNSKVTLAKQIYRAFKEQMVKGNLRPGEALPSTRELATILSVSRNTACEAYELLSTEGYIISRQGSATRVASGLYLEQSPVSIDNYIAPKPKTEYLVDFRTGQPDLNSFPRHSWLQALRNGSNSLILADWGYTTPNGLFDLRRELSAWLFRSRGIKVSPDDLFISSGATQALHLIADILYREGCHNMLVEDPCHSGMLRVLKKRGFSLNPIPVDKHGIQTDCLNSFKPGALYVTPSHQFPLGGILPAGRRTALVRYARQYEQYIIEDDYDSEFRYSGLPVAPLYTLDPQRVIYVGTFSKILFPSLRIGYVILPRCLQALWKDTRIHTDVQNPPFEQAALAAYLASYKLDRHIKLMRRLYRQRRNVLLASLQAAFDNNYYLWGDATGLHVALEFPGKCFNAQFTLQTRERGLNITTVNHHCINKSLHRDKILLGYGHLKPQQIQEGIRVLKEILL